jgi:hypothetical protein
VPLLPPDFHVQVIFVPVSQDELWRGGTAKTTGFPEQLPTTVWSVPGPRAGAASSDAAGQEVLVPVHTSALSQLLAAARQIAPALPATWLQPPTLSHESTVHGFWSSQLTPAPATQAPAVHTSAAVHALPSLQGVPSGTVAVEQTPVEGLHTPARWHWSPAGQITGFAPEHVPAWQVSVWVQALPSSQLPPDVGAQVPSEPGTLQAWHCPHDPCVLQHTPSTQVPAEQSLLEVQGAP